MGKPMFKVGDKVKIASDNDNENYDKFRGKTLIVTHVAKNTDEHRGYDDSMEGMALYDFRGVPFSLYEYELESSYAKGSTVKGNKYNGRYDSIHDFVSENKLEKEADNIFGKGWEADNDVEMIEVLLEKIGNSEYVVKETGNYINVKASYGNGGGVAVSSESGLAVGTNAELLMNEQNLQYRKGGGVGMYSIRVWESEDDRDMGESFIIEKVSDKGEAKEKAKKMYQKNDLAAVEVEDENGDTLLHLSSDGIEEYADGGNMSSGYNYSIGGL